ncbi:MAG: bifunctional adenosylcobinamide kinase/adenosylcobinamide-phosphate guanylyltransferase [Balneolaceae bacterium]|nr:bifunctional adenosylcobinamide kinase/adenosylcobinamide-phosphate guanylyltransferase [Balneolaceae bacterium]
MMTLVTGGARSGKSSFAQKRALRLSPEPVYIATAEVNDEEFSGRVKRHQLERGSEWTTFEANRNIHELPIKARVVVLDCVTLWLAKIFSCNQYQTENSLKDFAAQFNRLCKVDCTLIIVTNEIGMGVHAQTESGRKFTDLQGWANQHIAEKAVEVICMISGIPLKIKPLANETI